jgi:hypothetical protein
MVRAGSLAPGGRRARGRAVAQYAGMGTGRRLGEEQLAHLPLPTAAALPRGGWVGVARQLAPNPVLNACQVLSTEIPSLACGARRARNPQACSTLEWVAGGACPTPPPPARARELWKRDAHGVEKQHELIDIVFDKKMWFVPERPFSRRAGRLVICSCNDGIMWSRC